MDKALEIKPDYVEAMTYKGLLLRTQALIEKDPKKQQELIREGTALSDKANAMRKAASRATSTLASGDRPKLLKTGRFRRWRTGLFSLPARHGDEG